MFGLIGYPLGHSFSKIYFTEKFKKEDIDESYQLFPIENIYMLPSIIERNDLKGLNVTIPYKKEVMSFLDEISQDVEHIGAVNVIKIFRDDTGKVIKLKGFNSDWIGFKESLKPLLRPDIKSALVLGSGGASKAIVYALKTLGITPTIVSRQKGDDNRLVYDQLTERIIRDNLLIVNTTPLGMYPNTETCPDIPYHYLTNEHVCYDLVYNPEVTEFMNRSLQNGATVKNGLEMLYRQADEAWKIWNT